MEIKVKKLQSEELEAHREDLVRCMEDSLKVNNNDKNSGGVTLFTKK